MSRLLSLSRRRLAGTAGIIALVVLLGSQTVGSAAPAAGPPGIAFTLADVPGTVTRLYPGAAQPRPVRITNPNAFDIAVVNIAAVVGTPSNRACPVAAVTVDTYTGLARVPGRGTADVALTVRMSPTASDACKNTSFPLSYTAKATKP